MKKRSKKKLKKRLRKARKKALRQQRFAAEIRQGAEDKPVEGVPALELTEQELSPVLEGYDESALARAKTHWFFGEWHQLAALDMDSLCAHPDRDRFALLIASAHQQLGDHDKARKYTRMALNWECPHQIVAQVLIAGVHNTLGRAAALKQDEARIAHHFEDSVAAIGSRDAALVSHARSVREMARMGLLPQAAMLVDQKLQVTHEQAQSLHEQEAHYKVLKTEIELLTHELSLAQQRQQIHAEAPTGGRNVQSADPNDTKWLEGLKKRSVSQLGQDLWVLEQTGYKQDGFFVDFGATDGVLLSNSFLLEKEFCWTGICAEPNPCFHDQLKKNRNCIISNACIDAETGNKVKFVLANEYGGIADMAMKGRHGDKVIAYESQGSCTTFVTISLEDFLIKYNAPKEIDYLSIDTEGSEYRILSTFPFENWTINFISVEHNYEPQRKQIYDLLTSLGYLYEQRQWDDLYSLNRGISKK